MANLDAIREALEKLKLLLADDRIDEESYARRRELILGDLTPSERSQMEGTPTPRPRTGATFGPSGGRTRMPTLAELEIQPGTVLLDQWRIVRELGRGGFGAVFEAEDIKLGRTLAVKVLDPAMAAKAELLARFRREVTLMRELAHERIVRVYDYREEAAEHLALITMEYVRGCSVADVLALARASREPVSVPLALAIFEQTLEALAAAHAQAVIHRDVTPGNILLAGGTAAELMSGPECDPRVKLVDFGIAGLVERTELSAKSRVLGTAAYVAPEVLDPDAEITPEADVYGAGAVAYELLTGKTPLVTGHRSVIDLRADVPEESGKAVDQSVKAVPADRPSAQDALSRLAGQKAELERARAQEARADDLRRKLAAALTRNDEAVVARAAAALREIIGEKWNSDSELVKSDAWLLEKKRKREEAAKAKETAEEQRRREREAAARRRSEEERKRNEQEETERKRAAEGIEREEVARQIRQAEEFRRWEREAAEEKAREDEQQRTGRDAPRLVLDERRNRIQVHADEISGRSGLQGRAGDEDATDDEVEKPPRRRSMSPAAIAVAAVVLVAPIVWVVNFTDIFRVKAQSSIVTDTGESDSDIVTDIGDATQFWTIIVDSSCSPTQYQRMLGKTRRYLGEVQLILAGADGEPCWGLAWGKFRDQISAENSVRHVPSRFRLRDFDPYPLEINLSDYVETAPPKPTSTPTSLPAPTLTSGKLSAPIPAGPPTATNTLALTATPMVTKPRLLVRASPCGRFHQRDRKEELRVWPWPETSCILAPI